MKKMNYKNRGMFLESIINKTIKIYKNNEIALFNKISLDIGFKSIKKDKKELIVNKAYIKNKSTIDYIGIYEGVFVAFEAKSTEKDYLSFSNIKEHQDQYLKTIIKYGGIAFYIVCFKELNEFYIIEPKYIDMEKNKKIKREFCLKHCFSLDLEYPGILNITCYLNQKL